jgi:hypothetical protein
MSHKSLTLYPFTGVRFVISNRGVKAKEKRGICLSVRRRNGQNRFIALRKGGCRSTRPCPTEVAPNRNALSGGGIWLQDNQLHDICESGRRVANPVSISLGTPSCRPPPCAAPWSRGLCRQPPPSRPGRGPQNPPACPAPVCPSLSPGTQRRQSRWCRRQ